MNQINTLDESQFYKIKYIECVKTYECHANCILLYIRTNSPNKIKTLS